MSKSKLNKNQQEGVNHKGTPLLIIAGAGTGKTTVITNRIAKFIEDGVSPDEILALTFTEKAATEMSERVDELVPYGYANVDISTFHSFGDKIIRENALTLGLDPEFKVLTSAETVIFLKENLFKLSLDIYRPLGNPSTHLAYIINYFSRLKDEDVTVAEYLKYAAKLQDDSEVEEDFRKKHLELSTVYKEYEELMLSNGFLDFGDQVVIALKLFREQPSVLNEYRAKYKYILTDEFQDTNYSQFELLKLLAPKDSDSITVVADDDQSIYKFRGAAVSNVLGFLDYYNDTKIVTLVENYRSLQSVLNSSYRLICHNNPDRLEVKEGIDKKLKSQRKEKVKNSGVFNNHFDALYNEVNFVVSLIEKRVKEEGANYSDFAILIRRNKDAEAYINEFNSRSMAFRFSGAFGLYKRPEVELLITVLKVFTNNYDNISVFGLITGKLYGLKSSDVMVINQKSRTYNLPFFKTLKKALKEEDLKDQLTEEGLKIIEKFIQDIEKFSDMALEESAGRVLYKFVIDTGYLGDISQVDTIDGVESVRNTARFFEMLHHMENTVGLKTPKEVMNHIAELIDAGDSPRAFEADSDEDHVSIMTVHRSKGLEFPVVFMVGLTKDVFPGANRKSYIELPDEIIKDKLPEGNFFEQEERRLFYVAMTRAMFELHLVSSEDHGSTRMKKISPFVLEAMDKPQAEVIKGDKNKMIELFSEPQVQLGAELLKPISYDKVLKLTSYQIDDYSTCPLKYKFVHILKIPIQAHHTIVYGNIIHEVLGKYFEKKLAGQSPDKDFLIEEYKRQWNSAGYISKEHEKIRYETGLKQLEVFYERDKSHPIIPVAVEKEFTAEFGNNHLRGRWDLLAKAEGVGGDEIVDFKTSRVTEQDAADTRAKQSSQLRLYSLSYKEKFGKVPDKCSLYFFESGLTGSVNFSDRIMANTEKLIDKVSIGIRKREFGATPTQNGCEWCAFENICTEKF